MAKVEGLPLMLSSFFFFPPGAPEAPSALMSDAETEWTGWTSPWQPRSSRITRDARRSAATRSPSLRSFPPQRGLCLFVLSSRAFAQNDEIQRHFCLTFINYDVGTAAAPPARTNAHTYTHSISPFPSLSACVMMKALSLHPYYQKRGQCKFTLTSLRV